jgi:hypothetical protein
LNLLLPTSQLYKKIIRLKIKYGVLIFQLNCYFGVTHVHIPQAHIENWRPLVHIYVSQSSLVEQYIGSVMPNKMILLKRMNYFVYDEEKIWNEH